MGVFLFGYMPSFWVKIRPLGSTPAAQHTRISHIFSPVLSLIGLTASKLPPGMSKTVPLPVTQGSVFICWCWICIAFADVGAYFTGKNFGKTPLGRLAPAAGATSPNKTVEGLVGGCVVSGALGMLGAWVQDWPRWYFTGAGHGVMLAMLGLVGDLTASMLKRDAGLKDFGDLIPEHGGVLDRVDSFIFSAPYSYFVIRWCLPFWKKVWGVP
jgi:CDP-diglyceride synthetase